MILQAINELSGLDFLFGSLVVENLSRAGSHGFLFQFYQQPGLGLLGLLGFFAMWIS